VIGNNQEAEFVGILGATGCGKTTELKKRLAEKSRPRTLITTPRCSPEA
jgi:ABC-type nitrate/sulfonate/bicarbonate transport system ATPase subunit